MMNMTRAEKAAQYKRSHNCCQAVLLAYEDLLPLDHDTLIAVGSTFGSGMGGMQGTCGALTGAEMVLGMLNYKGSNMNRYSRELFTKFAERCGASACIDIKGVLTGRVLCSCEDCCRHAAAILEEML
jgi:C_GCAxxG_C_C family probable redox protein